MFRLRNPFRPAGPAVLSLEAQAGLAQERRARGRFEVLVRHLLDRFMNHELLSTDGETTRAVQLGYLVALPGLLFALYLFPAYHAPVGFKRTVWAQVGDHYFFVVYSMVLMGVVTVYEWDLLFPDLLDVFVLSSLPIRERRLFAARVLAVGIFLGLVLVGVDSLGTIFMPMVADLPSLRVHLVAHAVAVGMSGVFAAGCFLAVQGVLLNVVGERTMRRITPVLQGGSIMILLTVLFLFPAVSGSLDGLLHSGSGWVRWFPPFWFLGVYEQLLGGRAGLAISPSFPQLARLGCWATAMTIGLVVVTYPVAYRRRVRQLIEGPGMMDVRGWLEGPVNRMLDATLLRVPARRAIFHFVGQTLLRTQRQRVLLAMYGGVGVAIAVAGMVSLRAGGGRVGLVVAPEGLRAVVPVLVFWTVMGLRTVLAAPVDRRGAWLFRVVLGRASLEHLMGARVWVVVWALMISFVSLAGLHVIAPASFGSELAGVGQAVIAVGLCLLLTDFLFLRTITVPFTVTRKSAITDMPWVVVRYLVAFPVLVLTVVEFEGWVEMSVAHVVETVVLIAAAHGWWRWRFKVRVREMRIGSDFEEDGALFQVLGLQDLGLRD